jgi:hypothetical protein
MSREWKVGKQGTAGAMTGASGAAADAPGPGKRTLTEGLQLKPDGGPPGGGSGSAVQPPQPQPSPQPPSPQQPVPPGQPQPPASQDMVSLTVHVDGQYVQVYIAPGGIDHKPNVFLFFHGHQANLGIDPKIPIDMDSDNVSGKDTAAAAVQQAKALNTVVLLPQGAHGGRKQHGGRMPALRDGGSLPSFVDDILAEIAGKVPIKGDPGPVVPAHIALAGHSAGGYEGVNDALRTAGKYADTITDITLMDSSYADVHFEAARDWAFRQPSADQAGPAKTIRIVQSEDQILRSHHDVQDPKFPDDPTKTIDEPGQPHWVDTFGSASLESWARTSRSKMTVKHIVRYDQKPIKGKGSTLGKLDADRGNNTGTVQHTQLFRQDGQLQCDILVLRSDLGHHEIRDNVMDDAIDSIGQGAAGSDSFGKNQIPYYGRDPQAPHANNQEHVPGEPQPKQKPKR